MVYIDTMPLVDAEQTGPTLSLDSGDYNIALADLVKSAGLSAFYANLAALLARLTGCRDYLAVRYTPFGAPSFLVNKAMDETSMALYLDELYRLDPLRKLSRQTRQPTIVSLRALSEAAGADERYMLELFKSAFIFDELAMLLPAPGGVSIAVCCERRQVKFRDHDHRVAETILPVIAALHRLHIERAFAFATARGDADLSSQQGAFLILDQHRQIVHESPSWNQFSWPGTAMQSQLLRVVSTQDSGELALQEDLIGYWELLSADFPLAPKGKIITLERQGGGALQLTLDESLATFRARWKLTDRETDIVRLILVGYPNSHIAKSLNISTGTVKNHRHRLYYKLDITTERELFSMFLSQVVGREVETPELVPLAGGD